MLSFLIGFITLHQCKDHFSFNCHGDMGHILYPVSQISTLKEDEIYKYQIYLNNYFEYCKLQNDFLEPPVPSQGCLLKMCPS